MVADTVTPNLKLTKAVADRKNWSALMNGNLSIIDAAFGTYFSLQNLQGVWQNSTAYTVGQTVIDEDTSAVWQCQIAHTSAAIPTTFAKDRAHNATYWTIYSSPARARGAWTAATNYAINDFVVNGSQYAICIQAHTSTTSFSTDVLNNKWSILVDLSSVGSSVLPTPGGAADANKFVVMNNLGTGYTIITSAAALSLLGATSVGTLLLQAGSAADGRTAINAQIASANLTTLAGAVIGAYGLTLLSYSAVSDLKASLGLGTAAYINVGTSANQVVQLDGTSRLPAVDGSQLTNLPAGTAYFSTGDIKITWKTVADSGWIMHSDGTIGSATSGATYAAADASALFTLIWSGFNDTQTPVFTSAGAASARGANAAADFAANKRLSLPKALGRAIGVAGSGSGLTARTMGTAVGEESHILTSAEQASMSVTGSFSGTISAAGHTGAAAGDATINKAQQSDGVAQAISLGTAAGSISGTASGGGGSHNNMQPTNWYNVMIKL